MHTTPYRAFPIRLGLGRPETAFDSGDLRQEERRKLENELSTLTELDDKAGAELARELDFNEAGIGTFQRLRRAGGVTGHGAQCGSPRGLESGGDFRMLTKKIFV